MTLPTLPRLFVVSVLTSLLVTPAVAGTFRHKVNGALQSADPNVSSLVAAPDGSKVYFRSDPDSDGSSSWYWVPGSGGAATLLSADGPDYDTRITSDGAYLVGENGDHLVALSTSAGTETVLASIPSILDEWEISPDGAYVAYESGESLFVVSSAGGTATEVTPTGGSSPSLGKWSFVPDSSGIVFCHRPDNATDIELYSVSFASIGIRILMSDPALGDVRSFTLAPDSGRIVFAQENLLAGTSVDLLSIPPYSLLFRTTIATATYLSDEIAISADSTKVYWSDTFSSQVYQTSISSNTQTGLMTGGTVVPALSFDGIQVTPDGTKVVFIGQASDRYDLYSLATTGGTPVRINAASVGSPEPEWSTSAPFFKITPNSLRAIYLCDEDANGTPDLMSGRLDGGGTVRLDRDSLSGDEWLMSFGGIDAIVRVISGTTTHVIYRNDEAVADRKEIYAIQPNGVGRTRLNHVLSPDASASYPSFAEDNSMLVYSGDHNGDGGTEPWVVTIPGFADSQLVDLPDVQLDVGDVCLADGGDTLFYSAFQDSPVHLEVYSAPYSGGTPVKVNGTLGTGVNEATALQAAPGGGHLRYMIYDEGVGYGSYVGKSDGSGSSLIAAEASLIQQFSPDGSVLYFVAENASAPGTQAIMRRTLATGVQSQVTGAAENVTSFTLSGDGATLVYVASVSGGARELYSLNAAGGTPVKLNPALVANGNVASCAISADSSKVVFSADAVTDEVYGLYSVPIGGGTSTVLEAGTTNMYPGDYSISPDSSKVVFSGDLDTLSLTELYAVPIGGGTRTKLNSALVADGDVSTFEITADSSRVIYMADGATATVSELYSAKLDGTSTVKLNAPLVSGGEVNSFDLSSDGTWVAYRADQFTDDTLELLHVSVTGGTATRLHGVHGTNRDVSHDYTVVGSDHVVFRADHGGSDDEIRLFCTKVPGFITNRLDNNTLSTGDVTGFEAAENGAFIAYKADQVTDGSVELFVVYGVPDVTPVADQIGLMNMPLGPLPFTATDLETPSNNLSISATSSNTALISNSGITIGGTGSSRNLTLVPKAGQWGLTTITVTVSDGVHEADMDFDVRIIPDPNAPPVALSLSPLNIPENLPAGTVLGILNTIDPDPWDLHTYTLVGGDIADLSVSGNQLLTARSFDFEARSTYNLIIRTTDFVGAFWEQNMTISVADVSGKPLDFAKVGVINQRFPMSEQDFINHFELRDGPALERIRIESAPAHGSLSLRFPEEEIDTAIAGPKALVPADMNGDGRMDLVVAASGSGTNALVWYEQAGTPPRFPVPAGLRTIDAGLPVAAINSVAASDLDRDGDIDLVASCGAPNNIVYLYRNMGGSPPSFVRSTLTSATSDPTSVVVARLDPDPEWDIIVGSAGDNTVRVYRRNGGIPGLVYLPVETASTTESGVAEVRTADLNADGLIDIVCANRTTGEVGWLRNNGTVPTTFGRQVASSTIPGACDIAIGDLDKDGRPDIVAASSTGNRINWLRNDGASPPAFIQRFVAPAFNDPSDVDCADVDGDGDADVLAASATDGQIALFENEAGTGASFIRLDIDRGSAGASCAIARDLDGDGKPDMAACAGSGSTLSWYRSSILVGPGKEIDIDETQKLIYQPNTGHIGSDSFVWRGHDGVQWSLTTATVTFSIYGTEYWNWLVANFTIPVVTDPTLKPDVWGPSADPDEDGANNITEYALNTDPNDPSGLPGIQTEIQNDGGLDYLFVHHPVRKNETSLVYTLETSTDLSTWNSGTAYFSHVPPDVAIDSFFDSVTYRLSPDVASAQQQFVRVKIDWLLD